MKKDASVELVRIIGCLIVIGVHTCLGVFVNDTLDFGRLYIAALLADGVAVFWMISGFFLFENNSYKRLLKKTAKNIVFPMVTLSVVMFYLRGWLIDGVSIRESISHPPVDYLNVVKSLIRWKNPVENLGHFWYLYVYLLVICLFPLLKAFVSYIDESKTHTRWFLIISFVFLLVNDISNNELASFSHHSINALFPACIEIIWGHILYRNKEQIIKRKYGMFSIGGFLLLNILRMGIQAKRYAIGYSDNAILYWYTSIGLLCAICVICFCFAIMKMTKGKHVCQAIRWLGSYTMSIYMIHPIVVNIFRYHNVQNRLQALILQKGGHTSIVYEFAYTICILVIVFIISLVASIVIRGLWNCIKKLLKINQVTR